MTKTDIQTTRGAEIVSAYTGVEMLVEAWIAAADVSAKTAETYARAIKQYEAFLDDNGIDLMHTTRDTVVAYKKHIAATAKPATGNAYLTAVRRFYAYLESVKVYPNIAAGVKSFKRTKNSPKNALSVEQAKDLLSMDTSSLQGLRDYAIINLMTRRGLRCVEVARANVEDLQTINGEAVLKLQGKGASDKEQYVILRGECLKPINDYLAARGKVEASAPLFAAISNRNKGGRMTTRSISRLVTNELKAEGIKNPSITAHSLRHTAVTLSLLGGATAQETQQLARHASIETTFIYAHNLDRLEAHAERSVDSLLAI